MSLNESNAGEALGELQDKGDEYTRLAVIEKKRMIDLEDAIDYIKNETEKYRQMARAAGIDVMNMHTITPNPAHQRADGAYVGRHAAQATQKILTILEVKLNKLLQRKSEVINENKAIKADIDHYRRLRLQTDATHAKFEVILKECKENIETLLCEATQAMEERDKIMEDKEKLEKDNIKEQKQFEEEYNRSGEFVRQQNRALDDALVRERRDSLTEKINKTAASTMNEISLEAFKGSATLEEEIEMARQVGIATTFVQAEQNSLFGIQDKICKYENIFEQLKKTTGTDSLKDVLSKYTADEEEMFSLYNFIQTVNAEIDQIVELSYQTEKEISKEREQQRQQDSQRENTLSEQRAKLNTTKEATRQAEEQNKLYTESIQQISKKVGNLFSKLQCETMDSKAPSAPSRGARGTNMTRPESKVSLLTLGGQQTTPTESNVLDYMGCVEQRALEVISEYIRATQENQSLATRHLSPTPGPTSPMNWPTEPKVSVDDLSDDDILNDNNDEGDSKPVDITAFKEKMKKKLNSTTPGAAATSKQSLSERAFRK